MKKRIFALLLAWGLLAAAGAWAQGVYTYGGSDADWLTDIVAAPDGRLVMTGFTSSSDGTLASRTKTGQSGWVLCTDGQGNVLWSFCTRQGAHDSIKSPVMHEDGSVTVILDYESDAQSGYELVRLSASGEVMSRRNMSEGFGAVFIRDDGYAIAQLKSDSPIPQWNAETGRWEGSSPIILFDWEGNRGAELTDWTGSVTQAAGRYAIHKRDGASWLCRRDDQGQEQTLSKIEGSEWQYGELVPVLYTDMIELEDGGAAACGWILIKDTEERKGLISRWDAQGRLVAEMIMETGVLDHIVRTADGFAASSCAEMGAVEQTWAILFFDEQCVLRRRVELGKSMTTGNGCALAVLPDGAVAAVQPVGSLTDANAQLTIVPTQ